MTSERKEVLLGFPFGPCQCLPGLKYEVERVLDGLKLKETLLCMWCSTNSAVCGHGVQVTCGSLVKLLHSSTQYRLHSHEIPYGSGSGQQSVTSFPRGDDSNSYWIVRGTEVGLIHYINLNRTIACRQWVEVQL